MRLIQAFRRCLRRKPAEFAQSRRGAAALEFSLLALPYFLLLASIIEIGLISLNSVKMKDGMREAARMSRVGQGACMTQEEFETVICTTAAVLPNCPSRLTMRQIVFPTGWQDNLLDEAANAPNNFANPSGGDVVVMEATYNWQVLSPVVAPFLGDRAGQMPIRQSFAFQTEGFDDVACGGGEGGDDVGGNS